MSTESETETQTSTRSAGDVSAAGWLLALLGLWVLVTPFFWGPQNAAGFWDFGGNWLYWSNIVTGIVIAGVAAWIASEG